MEIIGGSFVLTALHGVHIPAGDSTFARTLQLPERVIENRFVPRTFVIVKRDMSPSISIVVIEDDPVVRQNVSYLINETPGMACVHTYDSVTAFMANEPTTHNDLYWVDINLPGGSGIELVRHLHTKNPDVRCLICSLHDDDHHVFEAMRAGASGYLLKNASVEQMPGRHP